MSELTRMALLNAALAAALAVPVALACRFLRRPALVHGLWLLVLLKMLTPPLLGVAILPRSTPPAPARDLPASALTAEMVSAYGPPAAALLPEPNPIPRTAHRLPSLADAAGAVWLAGAAAVLLLAFLRGRRFQALLRDARPAPTEVRRAAEVLGARIGVRRVPPIRLVEARIAPMLWWRARGIELLLPAGLIASIPAARRDALLAHELAHLRRRDHWVRLLELAATAAFWWSPVTWWTRSRLRRAEERSCDAWVVRALPAGARPYADALLDTLTFLSGSGGRLPALASGIGEVHDYEERLTMILRPPVTKNLPSLQRLLLAGAAIAVLLTFPTWAERPPAPPAPAAEPGPEPLPAAAPSPAPAVPGAPDPGPLPPAPAAGPSPPAPARGAYPAPAPFPAARGPHVEAPMPTGPALWDDGIGETTSEAEERYRDLLLDLEREALLLEERLQELRMRQQEIQMQLHEELGARERERLEAQALALEAEGRSREAEQLRREYELMQRKLEMEQMRMKQRSDPDAAVAKRSIHLAMLELEKAERDGDRARAEGLRAQIEEWQGSFDAYQLQVLERQVAKERQFQMLQLEALRAKAEAAREHGEIDEAEQIERRMEALLREGQLQQKMSKEAWELQVVELRREAEALEAAGEYEKADQILEKLEKIEAELARRGTAR